MPRYQYVVMTNPVEGREDEFNQWYTGTHLKEVLQVPGFKTGSRYKVMRRSKKDSSSTHRYLALYEIESDDVDAVLAELGRRAAAGEFVTSTAIDRAQTSISLYELIAEHEAK